MPAKGRPNSGRLMRQGRMEIDRSRLPSCHTVARPSKRLARSDDEGEVRALPSALITTLGVCDRYAHCLLVGARPLLQLPMLSAVAACCVIYLGSGPCPCLLGRGNTVDYMHGAMSHRPAMALCGCVIGNATPTT